MYVPTQLFLLTLSVLLLLLFLDPRLRRVKSQPESIIKLFTFKLQMRNKTILSNNYLEPVL